MDGGTPSVANADATTIFVEPHPTAPPERSVCIASEPETWTAFAILLGHAPNASAHWQILVDQNAWLRAAWQPGDPTDWNDPQSLDGAIRDITAHPVMGFDAVGHVHRH